MLISRQIFSSLKTTSLWSIQWRRISKKDTILKKIGLPQWPKKPLTPYLSYAKAVRAQVAAENPDLQSTDLMKLLAQKWQKVPDDEKQKFVIDYKAEMEAYRKKVQDYKSLLTDEMIDKIKEVTAEMEFQDRQSQFVKHLKEEEKKFEKPKHPLSSYARFAFKNGFLGAGAKGLKEASRLWKELPEREKEKLKAEVDAEMVNYKKDLLKWEEDMFLKGNIEMVKLKTIIDKLKSYA